MTKAIVFFGVNGDWQTFELFDSVSEALEFCRATEYQVFELRTGKFLRY